MMTVLPWSLFHSLIALSRINVAESSDFFLLSLIILFIYSFIAIFYCSKIYTTWNLLFFLIGGKLLYNVVLASAIQKLKLAMIIHISWRRRWYPTPVLLPGKSRGQRSLVGCSPWGRCESGMTERLHFHFLLSCIGERNGNPLQCSCLENSRDGETWWAAVYEVAQSQTRLKRLSSSSSIHTSPFCRASLPSPHPSSLGHHRAPGWAPCVI